MRGYNFLNDALRHDTSSHQLPGYRCDCPQNEGEAEKRVQFKKLPSIFICQLLRFQHNMFADITEKNNMRFEFPFTLDVQPYCVQNLEQNEEKTHFTLCGVIVHQGQANRGHYISYVRMKSILLTYSFFQKSMLSFFSDQKWSRLDDSRVSEWPIAYAEDEWYGGGSEFFLSQNLKKSFYHGFFCFSSFQKLIL